MHKLGPCLLGLSLAVSAGSLAAAQETSPATPSIPKILQITREYIKPYKNFAAHDKTEGAYVQALTRAKWPTHYVGLNSLSGKIRALYLTQYASLDAWQMDIAAVAKNSALSADLEHAGIVDGQLLDEVDQGVFLLSEEMSFHSMADLSHQRFMEITAYQVKPGHAKEFNDAVKLVKDAYEKADIGAHWAMFRQLYGGQGGRFLVLTSRKSLAEIDKGILDDAKFGQALGEDGVRQLDDLVATSVESSQHELFRINPRQSYVPDEWIKADPAFWKPKPAPAAKAATEEQKQKP
jgi:hypothetical protein